MTTYRKIHGRSIQAVTTDPTESVAEGQVWYNTSSDTFKSVVASEAWSSASPTINLTNNGAGAGAQTASLTFGGRNPPGPAFVATTEEYNGSGWSAGGALNTARSYLAGFGTQTAGVAAGGRIDAPGTSTNATEEYNGSSWTTVNNMGTARRVGGSAGIVQTAGLAIGGGPPGVATTEEYDGTNWTSGGGLNTARFYLAGFGTQTSAVAAGGNGGESAAEEYDGSSWTTVNSLNTGRTQLGSSGSSETDGIVFGGEAPGPTIKADAESYNGTSWTEGPNLGTARRGLSGSSGHSASAALATAGYPTYNLTEEFNKSANVITAAAWASGPALGTGRYSGVSGGTTTAAILAGGGYPRDKNETELYDGTSWSEVNNMNSGRGRLSGTGTPSSAVGAGGYTPGSYSSAAEQWDGTNWSNITSLPQGRQYMGSIGASGSAALFIGGNSPGTTQTNETLYWNGSSWATGGNYPNTVWNPRGFGTISAGISCGGNNGPTTSSNSYNGSSWTSGPSLNIARDNCGASGATDGDGLIYGGGSDLTAEKWDGTSFATSASFANSHNGGGSNQNGSSSTAMIFGDAPAGTAFEEFTGETTALNVKTLTQS